MIIKNCQVFDYTCDDCVLPLNHYDDPRINDDVGIRQTTKKEIKRVRSLRRNGATNIKGLYFVAPDNKAYIADSLKDMLDFNKRKRKELTAQQKLL